MAVSDCRSDGMMLAGAGRLPRSGRANLQSICRAGWGGKLRGPSVTRSIWICRKEL